MPRGYHSLTQGLPETFSFDVVNGCIRSVTLIQKYHCTHIIFKTTKVAQSCTTPLLFREGPVIYPGFVCVQVWYVLKTSVDLYFHGSISVAPDLMKQALCGVLIAHFLGVVAEGKATKAGASGKLSVHACTCVM